MFYLLPGMGANTSMYNGAWRNLHNVVFLDWPRHQGDTALSDVATRLIQEHGITANDWIGGSSLGGMVAIEIYKQLNNPVVVLLGSAMNRDEIQPLLRTLSPLASATPIKFIQSLTKNSGNSVIEMFQNSDPDFIKAMCAAIMRWDGFTGDRKMILRIHGEKDIVIKCPKDAEIIKSAGHLVAMTHSDECVRIIEKKLGAI